MNLNHKVKLTLSSFDGSFNYYDEFLVLDKITKNLPKCTFSKSHLKIPSTFNSAVPNFNISGHIDILLTA